MSRAGIKQIVLCSQGTLSSSPANPVALGLRNNCIMEITPFKTIKDYRGRELPNMDNIKIEAESLQPNMRMLKKLIEFTNNDCDAQITTARQNSGGASDDVIRLEGANSPGLEFELIYTAEKRSIKIGIERAYPKEIADSLLSVFDTQQGSIIPGLSNTEGIDYSAYRMPYILSLESPPGESICSANEFESRKLSIKTKGKKNTLNSSMIDYLTVTIELVTRNASAARLIAQRTKGISPSIFWKESNGGIFYDAFEFGAGILAQKSEFKNSDEERLIKIIYSADIPLFDFVFEFGTGKGGDESDAEGIKGGTLKAG